MSNFFFQKAFFKITLALLIFCQLPSCSSFSNIEDPNKKFIHSYKDQVGKINRQRDLMSKQQEKEIRKTDPEYNRWRDSAYVIGVAGPVSLQSAFVDTYKIKLPKPAEEFLPNIETLASGKGSNQELPDDVFTVSYSTENYPKSYKGNGVSFDDIQIPAQDAFGVRTALGEKNFTLVDRKALQKNIDYVRTSLKDDDKEVIAILVSEQKEIKYQKRWNKKSQEINDDDAKKAKNIYGIKEGTETQY